MYTDKQIKELTRDFKKDRVHTMNRILADWGMDIFSAKGRQKAIDATMNHFLTITRELAEKVEFQRGYKINGDWLLCAIAQIVPSQSTIEMFKTYKLDFTSASFPKAKGA